MQQKYLYAMVILVGLAIFTLIMLPNSDPTPANPTLVNPSSLTHTTETIKVNVPSKENTIATAWQWEILPANESHNQQAETRNKNEHSQADTASSLPFTQESIYTALHAVKLNEDGDIIIDHDALNALNAALDPSKLKLDDEALEELQDLIRTGLPGIAGEQTAQIVADYYQYLGAKSDFNTLYETRNNTDRDIDNYEMQYNELLALRALYLGAEVADQLFATANANSRYMFDSMKLEADTSLNEAEKKQQQAEIIERHAAQTINVNNWNERYRAFSVDKQNIVNSSLSDDAKRDQVTSLMHQHFSHEELELVSYLDLDSL